VLKLGGASGILGGGAAEDAGPLGKSGKATKEELVTPGKVGTKQVDGPVPGGREQNKKNTEKLLSRVERRKVVGGLQFLIKKETERE